MNHDRGTPNQNFSKSSSTAQTIVGRKRVRLVLSDDEGEVSPKHHETECSREKSQHCSSEDVAILSKCHDIQDPPEAAPRVVRNSSSPGVLEESTCSYKSSSSNLAASGGNHFQHLDDLHVLASKNTSSNSNYAQNLLANHNTTPSKEHITFKIDNELVFMDISSCMTDEVFSVESVEERVACLYYLHLPLERRMLGLLPIIKHMKMDGEVVKSVKDLQMFKNGRTDACVDVIIEGWVQKLLMKAYLECCDELSEPPNLGLLGKLYNMEFSEDEVVLSGCELQDVSILPLLNALHSHKTIALLDLSHNLLGNATVEKLQQLLTHSGQKYGGFILDLHSNKFGPTALFQICECTVLFTRLEVLNISGNRLTDACASYLSTILENCKALYSLKLERCSITSRTIQKLADSINPSSVLAQLWIGRAFFLLKQIRIFFLVLLISALKIAGYNAVSASALASLLLKLATLKRFSEVSLGGMKFTKAVLDSLCELMKSSSISGLLLSGTNIGNNGASQIAEAMLTRAQDLVRLDVSDCGLSSEFAAKLADPFDFVNSTAELNFGSNALALDGGTAFGSLLRRRDCCIRVLVMKRCRLGHDGVLRVLRALAENDSVEELDLSGNTAEEEAADSEDDDEASRKCRFAEEAAGAIAEARVLKLLDLSGNGLTTEEVDLMYAAWCADYRCSSARRHVRHGVVHFSTEESKCCKTRPCCRRD